MNLFWALPTSARGRRAHPITHDGARRAAEAAERLGYDGLALPEGHADVDPWLLAASLARDTQRLRLVVGLRPGTTTPALAARMAATLDRLTGGRLIVEVQNGGDPLELAGEGIALACDERHAMAAEFLAIWRALLAGDTVTHRGAHVAIEDARLPELPVQRPHPPLWLAGSTRAAHALAGAHADTYVAWAEPPTRAAERIADVRRRAATLGRRVSVAMRLSVIVRENGLSAWRAADDGLRGVDDHVVQRVHAAFSAPGLAPREVRPNQRTDAAPGLWTGAGLEGNAAALVGDPASVARRIAEYAALGVETFVLSSGGRADEIERVADLVLPRVRGAEATPALRTVA